MAKIKFRRDTAANWLDANPTLAQGEPGFEHDTGLLKIGDGATPWADLDYSSGSGGASLTDEGNVVVTAGSTAHWIATQRRDGYNTEPRGLRYDSEGNLYALTRTSEAQDSIAVITKYTAAGAVAWQKSFFQTSPTALAVDSSDCAYITVSDGDPEITVIKFSATGDILWKKSYDIGPVPVYSAFIEEKSSTTLALVAQAANGGPPLAVLVLEISSTDGSVSLKKTLALESPQLTVVSGMDVDGDENVFVTGYYYDVEADLNKMFIEKLDENLDPVWSKHLEAPNGYAMYGGDCASDAQGNIYAIGAYQVKAGNTGTNGPGDEQSAGILVKLNSSGTVQWTRRIGPGPCGSFVVGLTATDVGDVYLSSTTYVNKTDGEFAEAPEFIQEVYNTSKLIVARYNTLGAVIWQRYVDVVNLNEESSDFDRGQAVAVFGDKFAVDGYGLSTNNADAVESSETADNETDYFVVQLPTDGTELTIGNLSFTESRVPGRFVTHEATNSSLVVADYAETVLAEDSLITADAEARIANNIVKSETYSYTFGADGTLTIPNDGDVRLTQAQVGYLMAIGTSLNNQDDIAGRASTVDTQGYLYVGGDDDDSNQPFVMKISPEGDRIWGMIVQENLSGNGGRVNALSINPTTGNLMVLAEMNGNYTYSILVTVDQDTGRILDHEKFSDTDDDVRLRDIAWTSTGNYVLGGDKNGDFSAEIPVTAQTGSTTGTIIVLRSALNAGPNTNWQIGGTGIDPFENILYLERYVGLTGTTRQGSGAVFTIDNNGNGTYSALITTAGSNYLVGHKIKILGTDLGGATPDNDCIITVQSVDGSGGIAAVGNSGTAASVGGPSQITVTSEDSASFSNSTLTFSPRTRALTSVWSSFAANSAISFVIGGTTYTTTLADPPVSGSNVDPMNPIPFTINLSGSAGAPDGTVTEFTISTTSNLAEITAGSGLTVDSMSGPTETLRIGKPISNATFAAAVAGFPIGATIKGWNEMGSLSEFTLTSAFTEGSTSWNATFTRTSGSGNSFNSFIVSSPAGGGSTQFTGQSGTNTDVGSGFELTFEGPINDTNYTNYRGYTITAGGSNYVESDIIVIPGTSLGGTSPANDLTLRVSVSVGAVNGFFDVTGTGQSSTWKIDTTTQVDFSAEGSWSLTYPLSMEGLVVTPSWQRTLNTGTDVEDIIYAVAVDSIDNIIAVGVGYGELDTGNFRDLALVYKFNSSGTLQWVRQLNETGDDCVAQSVITIGTDIYVTHDSDDDGDTVITKLDSTGTVKWQRRTQGGNDSCIARTANGNLLVILEEYHNEIDDDAIKIFQMTASGEIVYKRWLMATTNDDNRLATPRGLCTDNDSFYIGAYFDTDDYQSGLAVRLPIDGSGTGEYGSFRYVDVNAETDNWTGTGLNDDNYTVNIVNLESENNYAGAPAVAPTVGASTAVTVGTGDFFVDSWYPDLTIETVHDTDGGSIVFADGSKQSTSATDIPQRRYFGQRYTLGMKDRGHHILCNDANDNIVIPYNSRVPFPVGTVITIVNPNSGNIGISVEGGSTSIMQAGEGYNSFYLIQAFGVVTLLKVGIDQWVISGNVNPD